MFNWFKNHKNSLIVTDMLPEDLPWVADIHASSFSRAWSDGDFRDILSGRGATGLVARRHGPARDPSNRHHVDGADIQGILVYRIAADEAEIITIATTPHARLAGIGNALLQEMIRRCLADRLTTIFLEVDSTNNAALALYTKHGFKQVGIRKAYYSMQTNKGGEVAGGNQLANHAAPAHDALILRLSLRD